MLGASAGLIMTKTRSTNYAHSLLALAAATANNTTGAAPDDRSARQPVAEKKQPSKKPTLDARANKQIAKRCALVKCSA